MFNIKFKPQPIRLALNWIDIWLKRGFDRTALLSSAVILTAMAFMYLRPGVFVVSAMLNDTLLYTESGYRMAQGQMPGIHFTSSLGIFAFLPHAIAYRLTGDLIQSIPISSVMFAAVVFTITAYFALTRLDALIGIGLTLTTSLLVMSPMLIGFDFWERGVMFTTIAMTYNKLGFVLVLLAALLPIQPKPQWQATATRFDAVFAIATFAISYYTKMSFGIAVACLVIFWGLFLQTDRRQLTVFLLGAPLTMLAIELILPGINRAYLNDMALASKINGIVSVKDFARLSLITLREILILAGLPIVAVLAVGGTHLRLLAFYLCLIGGSIVLLSQCAQGYYLVPLLAMPIAAITLIANAEGVHNRLAMWIALASLSYGFLTYMMPALMILRHHTADTARTAPIDGLPEAYASLRIPTLEGIDLAKVDNAFDRKMNSDEAFALARSVELPPARNVLYEGEYAHTLVKLADARKLCGKAADRAAILDFVNPASSLFGYQPVSGYAYAHFNRSFSASVHWAPERMFSGVDCLLDPKLPQGPGHREGLWNVYGPYLKEKFLPVTETEYWRVFVRNSSR